MFYIFLHKQLDEVLRIPLFACLETTKSKQSCGSRLKSLIRNKIERRTVPCRVGASFINRSSMWFVG